MAWAVPTAADSLRDNGVCLILLCLRLVLLPPQDQVSGEVALASYLVVLLLLLLCVFLFVCVCVCSIPANTAIYQSACVWVFLLSIFLLRERVTVLKVDLSHVDAHISPHSHTHTLTHTLTLTLTHTHTHTLTLTLTHTHTHTHTHTNRLSLL